MRSNAALAFEPEAILPAQLFANGRMDASAMPEKRLLLAVLEEAVVTYQRYVTSTRRRGQRLFREAEEWVVSDDASWPCSFRNVCDVLGFDVDYLRQGLLRWRDRQRSSLTPPTPYRHPFRRLSGSRTRAIGRPIGLGDRVVVRERTLHA
jgi:hypothetical protein